MWHHPRMKPSELIAALDRDSAAFVEGCEHAGLTTAVPSCPNWTVTDLLWHLTEVHDFWRTVVTDRLSDPSTYVEPERPSDDALPDLYRSGRVKLLKTLADADPTTSSWTWSSDKTAGFVIRRMAQETAIHRWDAESAAGTVTPVESTLASDGVDEFLAHFTGSVVKGAVPVGGSVHLHCGDVDGEWTVRESENGFTVTREHSKADCAIRGPASDILLAMWRRIPLATCDVVGDADVATRFIAHTNLD